MANNTVVLGNSRAFRNAIWNLFTRVRDPSLYPTLPHGKIVRHVISLSPGTRLGPYEILASLGAGGMGEVYRARDTRLGREVALKILSAEVANDPLRRQRFDLEARAVSALNHPNLVAVRSEEHTSELQSPCNLVCRLLL